MDPENPNCVNMALRDLVVPDPADAIKDRTGHEGCSTPVGKAGFVICTIGPKSGYDLHLAAVGDSHNRTLMPAYVWMAKKYNWRIDVTTHSGCYWTTAEQERDARPAYQRALCDTWRHDLAAHLNRPGAFDAVLTTHASAVSIEPRRHLTYEQTAVRGMVEAWTKQTPPDVPVVAILDNPQTAPTNTPCVEHFETDPARCATPRDWALRRFDGSAEAVEKVDKARLVDMTPFFCGPSTCPSVIGGVMVYRDHTHLTATYVTTLAPYLGHAVRSALRNLDVL